MFKFVHSICFVSVESITLLYQNQAKTMPRYKKTSRSIVISDSGACYFQNQSPQN